MQAKKSAFTQIGNFLRDYVLCFVPLIALLITYAVYYRLYLEFVESNPAKVILLTGLNPADVLVPPNDLSQEPNATFIISNAAYAARLLWSAMATLHICVCLAAIIAGIIILLNATRGYPDRLPIGIFLFFVLFAINQAYSFSRLGSYKVIEQVLQKTVAIAESSASSFPRIVDYIIVFDKIGFVVAAFLAIIAGMTLLKPNGNSEEFAVHLAKQMKLLRLILYVGTFVWTSAILIWSFTLRWGLVYVYPWNGPVHQSLESIVNDLVIGRGIYFSILLAATYIPIAAIHSARASMIADLELPKASIPRYEAWLKDQGLSTSLAEFLPRLAAILGPLLAGSITEAFKLLQ